MSYYWSNQVTMLMRNWHDCDSTHHYKRIYTAIKLSESLTISVLKLDLTPRRSAETQDGIIPALHLLVKITRLARLMTDQVGSQALHYKTPSAYTTGGTTRPITALHGL